jgi:hypothetical protein
MWISREKYQELNYRLERLENALHNLDNCPQYYLARNNRPIGGSLLDLKKHLDKYYTKIPLNDVLDALLKAANLTVAHPTEAPAMIVPVEKSTQKPF